MNQVEKLSNELLDCNFVDTETLEIILRNIEARSGKTRPAMRMIGHTAYLTFARKALRTDKD
jgi:tRNA (adenine57-N1/adenine58-N1)-methyltransferase